MVAESDLLESRGFLSDINVWPDPLDLTIEAWLANFDEDDKELARSLLESHVHVSQRQLAHGATSAFVSISTRPEFGSGSGRQDAWSAFIDRAYVTFPAAAVGDAAGSGQIFARTIRDAGFDDGRIVPPEVCVSKMVTGPSDGQVVFVDDISASGSQFARTWRRKIQTASGKKSFFDLAADGTIGAAYYVPLIATTDAIDHIRREAPLVEVVPAYTLEDVYFASAELTRLVEPDQRPGLDAFVRKYAARSGVVADGPYGFGGIGLALSFHHAIPNNTLPILQKRSPSTLPDWKVLIS
jgi:hypothetical protein